MFSTFQSDRTKLTSQQSLKLKEIIELELNSYLLKNYFKLVQKFYGFQDVTSIQRQAKIFLEGIYNYENGKFEKRISFLYLPLSFLKHIAFLILTLLYSKKKYKRKNFDVVIDKCDSDLEINRFRVLHSYLSDLQLIYVTRYKSSLDDCLALLPYKGYLTYEILRSCFKDGLILAVLLPISISRRWNIIAFHTHLINQYLYYFTLSKMIDTKFILQEKHYESAPIRDDIFKRHYSAVSASLQKNIYQIGRNGFYYFFDMMFTLGKFSCVESIKFGSEVKKYIPVGSYFFNSHLSKKTVAADSGSEKFDILFIGINVVKAMFYCNSYEKFKEDYYQCFEWLKSLSEDGISIKIKHHSSVGISDQREESIIKNSSISHIEPQVNSYDCATRSRIVVTYASTMGVELLAHGIPVIYLDPSERAPFYSSLRTVFDKIKVTSLDEFKARVEYYLGGGQQLLSTEERNALCLESHDTSLNIAKVIRQHL